MIINSKWDYIQTIYEKQPSVIDSFQARQQNDNTFVQFLLTNNGQIVCVCFSQEIKTPTKSMVYWRLVTDGMSAISQGIIL